MEVEAQAVGLASGRVDTERFRGPGRQHFQRPSSGSRREQIGCLEPLAGQGLSGSTVGGLIVGVCCVGRWEVGGS